MLWLTFIQKDSGRVWVPGDKVVAITWPENCADTFATVRTVDGTVFTTPEEDLIWHDLPKKVLLEEGLGL